VIEGLDFAIDLTISAFPHTRNLSTGLCSSLNHVYHQQDASASASASAHYLTSMHPCHPLPEACA
jgi:hypothetical protein